MSFLLQSQCAAILGHSGNASGTNFDPAWIKANVAYVNCPWVLTDGRNHFGHIGIHKMFASSLATILAEIWDAAGKSQEKIDALRYDIFSGSGCYRPMRTHNELSMHGYFAAIDWDAPDNPLHSLKHRFKPDDLLFVKFRANGWTCGIDWRGASVDAMHVQAPRVG
jgi:hypothetical protein